MQLKCLRTKMTKDSPKYNRESNSEFIVVQATLDHVEGISKLLKQYSKMGNVLPRTEGDITDNIKNFKVVLDTGNTDIGNSVVACGALEHFTEELIEIRSLVVNPTIQGKGLGKLIVNDLITAAKKHGAKRLMALTYSVGFFTKLGFEVVEKEIFPEKIWSICINCYKFKNCDETAVVLYL